MSLSTRLLISLVIATVASTITNILKTGQFLDWQLLIAFFLATAATALAVGRVAAPAATAHKAAAVGAAGATAQRERGTVKWFNVSKGFGFIVRENGEEIFVHFRSIRGEGRRGLRDGQSVSFVVAQSDKGPQAEDVAGDD